MVAISVNNLIKNFGDKTAVSIPDFCFPSNEIIGLVGNNGAGKTTLFRLILNLIKADSGIVNFCLTDENTQQDKANLNSNVTMVSHLEDAWKSYIAAYLDESFLIEFLTPKEFFTFIAKVNNIKEQDQALIGELVPKLLSIGEIQKVLQNLIREGISIRDLVTILETLADYATTTHDTDVLTEYARQGLKRAISNKYFPPNETTSVVTLDPKIEQEIMNSVKQTEQGAYLTIDPAVAQSIMDSLKIEIDKLDKLGKAPIVMTSPIVRMYFKKLTMDYFAELIVLSYNEVEANVELQSVGMVTI